MSQTGAPVEAQRRTPTEGVIGRDIEIGQIQSFVASVGDGRTLVLVGDPGAGKTTLWETAVGAATSAGHQVLTARASDEETGLSFAALVDLFDAVGDEELATLSDPQRRALKVALLREEGDGRPVEVHAVAMGLLSALRNLSSARVVLVALDDVQWLDPSSAEALAFVMRRAPQQLGFLLSRRDGSTTSLERAAPSPAVQRVGVRPLNMSSTRALLAERLGVRLSRHVLRRVYDVTLGNPLFALEVGHRLVDHGSTGIDVDLLLPDHVEDLIDVRVADLHPDVRRLVLAMALDADLRARELAVLTGPETLDDAQTARAVTVDGERVRLSHPLLAAAVRRSAGERERSALHLALSDILVDERRAQHLALGAQSTDEACAAEVAAAAEAAAERGAAARAALLATHALRLTPEDSPRRADRVLHLGQQLKVSGEKERLTSLLAPYVHALPPGERRVRALLLLTHGVIEDNEDIRRLLADALESAGDDAALRSPVLARMAENEAGVRITQIAVAESWALEALEGAPSEDQQRVALGYLGWAQALGGKSVDEVCAKYRALSGAAHYLVESPERVAGQRLVWRGELAAARELLGPLLAEADERGEPGSYALHRLHLCELALRAGDWAEGDRLMDEWADSDSELLQWPMYERCRALLAAGVGALDEGRRWAADAVERAERMGVRWDWLEARRAQGILALFAREPEAAVEALVPVWEHTIREGVLEPGVFPVAPDLVEALVETGDLAEASRVSVRLGELAVEQEHPWATATARRTAASIRLATDGYDAQDVADLERAATDLATLGVRFDAARTLIMLGRIQRRAKKWAAARETLQRAIAAFEELGSVGWASQARSDLDRVGARRPSAAGELTATERRVAELASSGMSNKQIASTLVVTVNTVEFHLRNTFAKLGIRSRGQLIGALPAARSTD